MKKQGKTSLENSGAHKVRIVGGIWKRTPLAVADVEGLRPTAERVRETLFNWLVHLRGADFERMHCLDMFAGTGALGFEAASRGMAHVTMVEENRAAYAQLRLIKEKLGAVQVSIHHADALELTGQFACGGRKFDMIFLDPPFQKGLLPYIVPLCSRLLTQDGLLYIESDEQVTEEKLGFWTNKEIPDLHIIRKGRAGQVYYHLLEMQASSLS